MQQEQALLPPLGMEQEVAACGRRWRIARRDLGVLERFYQWVLPQIKDPFDGLEKIIAKLSPEQAHAFISEAQAKREEILDWNSPVIERFMKTTRGQVHLFMFMLQVYQPDATLENARQIVEELGPERIQSVFLLADGQAPGQGKAPAPAGFPTRRGESAWDPSNVSLSAGA